MRDKRGIVWLASYPKSGNTWFRIFLTHLLNTANPMLNLNKHMLVGTGSSARFLMEKALGFDSKLLSEEELAQLRPAIYAWHGNQPGRQYFKIHDAFCTRKYPTPIISLDENSAIIYFIRNPLDVVISFAHHMNCTIDAAILMMNTPHLALKGAAAKPMSQVRQVCSSWSWHVESWTSIQSKRVLTLRYEDMHAATHETFSQAVHFLQLDVSEQKIEEAVAQSQFDKLKKEEQAHGFRESAAINRPFFRKGSVGDWENTLAPHQIEQIVTHHAVTMRRFGYVDEHNQPIYMREKNHDIQA